MTEAKEDLLPTHRHHPEKGWQRFEQVVGKWEPCEERPTQKLVRKHRRNGWQFFADPAGQPVEAYTLRNKEITPAERAAIERLLEDTNLTLHLMAKICPDLPSVPRLADVRDYITEFLKHNYWLEEVK